MINDQERLRRVEEELEMMKKRRIYQQDIIPGGIKARSLGDVIKEAESVDFSFTFTTGQKATITSTLNQDQGARTIAVPLYSFYVGSKTTVNKLPGGTSVDDTDFQFSGPLYDFDQTDGDNTVIRLTISNVAAGSVTILGSLGFRFITNIPGVEASA